MRRSQAIRGRHPSTFLMIISANPAPFGLSLRLWSLASSEGSGGLSSAGGAAGGGHFGATVLHGLLRCDDAVRMGAGDGVGQRSEHTGRCRRSNGGVHHGCGFALDQGGRKRCSGCSCSVDRRSSFVRGGGIDVGWRVRHSNHDAMSSTRRRVEEHAPSSGSPNGRRQRS